MKKFLSVFLALLTIASVSVFCSCKQKEENVLPLVLTVGKEEDVEGKTLKEYMEEKNVEFSISNGLVTEIYEVKNTASSYWMLYTDDRLNANEAWGVYELKSKKNIDGEYKYLSASLGAEELIVKQGYTYIWVYQSFN